MSDNIVITTHEMLGNETANSTHRTPDGHVPTGVAGFIVGECTVLCPACGDSDNRIKSHDDEVSHTEYSYDYIELSSEWDYPGAYCDECSNPLDTNLLVYRSQDPELFWKVKASEKLGFYNSVPDTEELAKEMSREAYLEGWHELGETFEGEWAEGGEFEDSELRVPTDSAHWANNVAPKLRALAGFEDRGYGTYQDAPIDLAHHVLNEDIHPSFRQGYYDRAEGREKGATFEYDL